MESKKKLFIVSSDLPIYQLFENGNLKTEFADLDEGLRGDVINNITLVRNMRNPNMIMILQDDKE